MVDTQLLSNKYCSFLNSSFISVSYGGEILLVNKGLKKLHLSSKPFKIFMKFQNILKHFNLFCSFCTWCQRHDVACLCLLPGGGNLTLSKGGCQEGWETARGGSVISVPGSTFACHKPLGAASVFAVVAITRERDDLIVWGRVEPTRPEEAAVFSTSAQFCLIHCFSESSLFLLVSHINIY